jgi:hypothetical protein
MQLNLKAREAKKTASKSNQIHDPCGLYNGIDGFI